VGARLLNLTPAEYHGDPLNGVPALSQSIAHTLISKSPLHAWQEHPLLGRISRPATSALDSGQIIHRLLLEKGADIAIAPAEWLDAKGKPVPAIEWRTNSAKDWKAAALADGKLPMLQHEASEFMATAAAIQDRIKSLGLSIRGTPESMVTWEEDGVVCKGMMDLLDLENGTAWDLKSIRSAHPDQCRKHMTQYGYHIQSECYRSAINQLRPELNGRALVYFIFFELEPPYAVLPAEADGEMVEMGERDWERAVRTWKKCLATNTWPGYHKPADGIVKLAPMPYAAAAAMEAAIREDT
jgi:hypothetical protein